MLTDEWRGARRTRVLSTARRSTTFRLLGTGLVAALAFTACGGDDGDESDDEAAPAAQTEQSDDGSPPEPGGEPDDGDAAGDAADGEVPDPCSLISHAELTSLLGRDPGNGESDAVMPDQRKVCWYRGTDQMVGLGVELASHYETSIGMFESPLQEVEGVGREAVWFETAFSGTLIALGEDYFVDINVGPDEQDAAITIAETMLAAA